MSLRLRSASLQVRLLAMSVLAAALVLAVGGTVLLAVLKADLLGAVDDAAIDSAQSLGASIRKDAVPREILATEEVTTVAQVVRDGTVIASTMNAVGNPPILRIRQQVGKIEIIERRHLPYEGDGPFRIAVLGTDSPSGPVTIYVAADAEDAYDVTKRAGEIGAAGALFIMTVLSVVLWFTIGSALAPVARIRERADDISKRGLHLRVPVPSTKDEIAALATTINSMLARIEAGVARQDAFVADAAHELRTPLATLRSRLDVALLQPSPQDDVLRDLLADVVRMGDLVEQMLFLARFDAGLVTLPDEPVDIDDLALRAVDEFDHPSIRLSAHDISPAQVNGNLALLGQLIPNLLANASRFAASRIDLAVRVVGPTVVITVDDDGPGIPEADRQRVFDRFIRLDQSRGRGTGGTGLGLAIVAQIVSLHGGHVEATQSPAGGARICIELPTAGTDGA